jgi:hypothetical protein
MNLRDLISNNMQKLLKAETTKGIRPSEINIVRGELSRLGPSRLEVEENKHQEQMHAGVGMWYVIFN